MHYNIAVHITGAYSIHCRYASNVPLSATAASSEYTHIAGIFPPTTPVDELGILNATGIFEGAEGTVRMSGALNFANAPNTILFSFFYVIDIETSSGTDYEYIFQQSGSMAPKQQVFLMILITVLGKLLY